MIKLLALLQAAIVFGTVILYGSMGEILTEKSGNLNLGVPGIMYLGGIAGLAGAFAYQNSAANPTGSAAFLIALACALGASVLGGLIYCFLTVTLRANQNVTGLTLTIFGTGLANLYGGAMNKMAGGVGQISVATASDAFRATIAPFRGLPLLNGLGCLVYIAIVIAIIMYDRHRMLTAFLVSLGVPEEIAREDACKMEHDISEESFTAICKSVGWPKSQ